MKEVDFDVESDIGLLKKKLNEVKKAASDKKAKNKAADEAKSLHAKLQAEAYDMFSCLNIDSLGQNGNRFKMVSERVVSASAANKEKLFDFLRDHGLGEHIKEAVNCKTLTREIKILENEAFDAWIEDGGHGEDSKDDLRKVFFATETVVDADLINDHIVKKISITKEK